MDYIIGIAGKANSGKDTVANMINYIFSVGVTKANYVDYCIKKRQVEIQHSDRVIHFADTLKDVLSSMFCIKREFFDDRKYKDELWYCFDTGEFVENHVIIKTPSHYHKVCLDELNAFDLRYVLEHAKEMFTIIKLRTLMQYFGTDICRRFLASDIWITSIIGRAVDIAKARKVCIIPDVRYANEAAAVRKHEESLYGGLIIVKRDGIQQMQHSSEALEVTSNVVIKNDSTLTNLFYKVLNEIQNLINQCEK